jgi:hypothetical protein
MVQVGGLLRRPGRRVRIDASQENIVRSRAILFLIAGFVPIASVSAQSPNGTISGIVFDSAQALIADAEITIVNDATNVQYSAKTNAEGMYLVTNLVPGPYRIQVAKIGFKTIIKPDIFLHVQDALAINFTLPLGAISEVVTVHGGTPLVDTQSAAVGTVIDRNFAENLPLNGRSFNMLLQLTPGVVVAPTNNSGFAPGQFSIAGQRTDANNFAVDGVSANFGVSLGLNQILGAAGTGSAQAFSVLGGTSSLVSVDALQEFRIETSSYAPEFGRSPGGQVSISTRSGTNALHGGVYEYLRNDKMDANDWFANSTGKPRVAERHNDFGASLGGPFRKDRTFFFASYEGARLRLPRTNTATVPSAYARSIAPAAVAPFLLAFPAPDNAAITPGVYTAAFTASYSDPASLDAGSIRVDHVLNKRFSLFGRYNQSPSELAQRSFARNSIQISDVNTRTVTVGVNMGLSPDVFNTLRANYSTQTANSIYSLDSFHGAVPIDPALFVGSLPITDSSVAFSAFDLLGNNGLYESGPIARNTAKQINFVDDLAVISGRHQLKMGADYRGIFTSTAPPSTVAVAIPISVQSLINTGTAFAFIARTNAHSRFLAQALSLYGQDRWKIGSRLTLTYGLRWEWSPAPSARGRTTFAAWTNTDNPAALALAAAGTPLWDTTYRNFAPRVGAAYQLTEKRDLIVRVGWGLFYDLGVGAAANVATTFPNQAVRTSFSVPLPVTNFASLVPSLSLQPPYSGQIYMFSSNLTLPRSYQWNVALEKSFGVQAVTATYAGQAGRDLLRNQGLTPPNASFVPGSSIFLTQNQATSDYNSLQVQYRRPLASRLQMLLNYTWAHSLDTQSDDTLNAASTVVLSAAKDRGPSSFDVRHSFSGAVTYDLPSVGKPRALAAVTRNWSLDTVVVARTGLPFNALFNDFTLPGAASPRPDLVPGQSFWIANPAAPAGKSLNPAAFALPSTVRQGTEGRNDIPGFGLTQVDLSIRRKLVLTERYSVQFRADAFNVFNHPNFTNPTALFNFASGPLAIQTAELQSTQMLNFGLAGLNPLFSEGGPRSLQLSLRLQF